MKRARADDHSGGLRGRRGSHLLLTCAILVSVSSVSSVVATLQPRVTFTQAVAPILFEHCASCHRPGQIAPFSLLTYGDARPRAASIARVTRARTMPPWKPEPGFGGEFIGAHRLTEQQINLIQAWLDNGAVEGDPADLPPTPIFPDGWRLGVPDLVVTLPNPFTLAASDADVLRNFVMPVPLHERRYVSAIEFHPGNARVVHHANLRIDRSGAARTFDAADPAPGFDGRITAGDFPDGYFLGWTPGQLAPRLPEGMSWRLDPDSDLVVQVHMHPVETMQTVQPSVGFFFTATPPAQSPLMLRLGRQNIDIPAGTASYSIEDEYTLPVDATVVAVQPHAHYRAREIKGYALLPDGTRQWLIYIKDWDFNWQDVYRYASPVRLPKGTTLGMQYTYDNSAANARNPDRPPKRVRWGQNSTDEMGDLWLQVLARSPDDRQRLFADFGPKVMAEDAIGYESLLAAEPGNARLHEAAASIYLALGQPERAKIHLADALRIDPRSAEAHYNLGLALVSERRIDDAARHFSEALAAAPDHVAARVNLGALLRAQGRVDEAIVMLRGALSRDPANAAAHTNLAGSLVTQGHVREAIADYRLALATDPDLPEPLTSLAWILAASPDVALRQPAEAVRLAEHAAAVTHGQNLRVLDTLGAAYAAAGNFDRAWTVVDGAARDALSRGLVSDGGLLRERADLYRRHRPYRDPALASR